MSVKKIKKIITSNKGMSIISVMMAFGLAGVLALVVAKISSNSTDVSTRAFSAMEEVELLNDIKLIVGDPRYCKISLVDNVPFRKTNVDGNPQNEGKDVELWLSEVDGLTRSTKKYNGENNPGADDKSKTGKITIRSIKLVMNNGTGNYPDSLSFSDIGELHIKIGKKSSSKTVMEKNLTPIKLRVQMKSTGGNTTILSCSQTSETDTKAIKVWASDVTWGNNAGGNTYSTFNCPDGYALAAVDVRSGNDWDSVLFQCRDLVGNYSNQSVSGRYGGGGGGGPGLNDGRCKCPGQSYISSIYMFTGSDSDGLGADCIDKNFNVVGSFGRCGSSNGGGAQTGKSICAPKSIASGALIRYQSDRIHTVRLLCSQKVETVDW
jgi:hypothetical protein